MRDFKADLEFIKDKEVWFSNTGLKAFMEDHNISGIIQDFVLSAREGWPEAINRAISAEKEIERLENELKETYTDDKGTTWSRPTAWAYYAVCKARDKWQNDAAALREQNDLQRQSVQELSCQVAALREWVKDALEQLELLHPNMNPQEPCCVFETWEDGKQLLASPDPGAKVKAVVDAADSLVNWLDQTGIVPGSILVKNLKQALADLEGGTPCE